MADDVKIGGTYFHIGTPEQHGSGEIVVVTNIHGELVDLHCWYFYKANHLEWVGVKTGGLGWFKKGFIDFDVKNLPESIDGRYVRWKSPMRVVALKNMGIRLET